MYIVTYTFPGCTPASVKVDDIVDARLIAMEKRIAGARDVSIEDRRYC